MRNRLIIAISLPIIIFLWIIGWTLFCLETNTRQYELKRKTCEKHETQPTITILTDPIYDLKNIETRSDSN